MSMVIRVCVEVGESATGGVLVRCEQIETVIPANTDANDWSDIRALGSATMDRLVSECHGKADEQLGQMGTLLGRAA